MSNEHNRGRVLTVRLTITDPDLAVWLWESGLGSAKATEAHGVQITALSNGDMFERLRKLEESHQECPRHKTVQPCNPICEAKETPIEKAERAYQLQQAMSEANRKLRELGLGPSGQHDHPQCQACTYQNGQD